MPGSREEDEVAALYRLAFLLSALGLVLSAVAHAASFLECTIPAAAYLLFFPGIFIVILPAMAVAGPRVSGRRLAEMWGALFEGIPRWLTALAALVIAYSLVAFFAIMVSGGARREAIDPAAGIHAPNANLRAFTCLQMVFYVISLAALHPANLPRKDPSASWPPPTDQELTFFVSDRALNGLRLGGAAGGLEVLGRPDNRRPFREGRFVYRRLGLIVETAEDRIDYLGFVMSGDRENPGPCRLTLIARAGARLALGPSTTRGDIRNALGEPARAEEDDDETVDTYEEAGLSLEFEYGSGERLQRFNAFPTEPPAA
jgi:hypothetical protein